MGAHSSGFVARGQRRRGVTDHSCCREGLKSYSRPPTLRGLVWSRALGELLVFFFFLEGERKRATVAHSSSWTATSLTGVNDPAADQPDQFCFGALSHTLHRCVSDTQIRQALTRRV